MKKPHIPAVPARSFYWVDYKRFGTPHAAFGEWLAFIACMAAHDTHILGE